MKPRILAAWCGACLLALISIGGCVRAPKVEDVVLSVSASPSGKIKATVIEGNVGLLNPPSILVMLHDAKQDPAKGTAVIAITEGSAPSVAFDSDTKLRVRLIGGTKHNQKAEALGVTVVYE